VDNFIELFAGSRRATPSGGMGKLYDTDQTGTG
jgi:hypothetical protein